MPAAPRTIALGHGLDLTDLHAASRRGEARLHLDDEQRARLARRRDALERRLAAGERRLYGINTGFADNRTGDLLDCDSQRTLQENLIRSHAAGIGPWIDAEVVRAAIAIRAEGLARGHSGVRPDVVDALVALHDSDVVPAVPEIGSVGASGDLAPLSHLALVLMGEGEAFVAGELVDVAAEADRIRAAGFDAFITLQAKEGLALNNGTAFMAAWLGLALERAEQLLEAAEIGLALTLEALRGIRYAFAEPIQELRPLRGVNRSARVTRALLEGSTLCGPADLDEPVPDEYARSRHGDVVQDDYSLRCAPCGHGTFRHALDYVSGILAAELRAVNDNPLLLFEQDAEGAEVLRGVWSAGHFHGAPLALPADHLRAAVADLASLAERRMAKMLDHRRNYGLPNYLASAMDVGRKGLKSGLMITQYAAAAAVNRLKTTAHPFGVDSITTGNDSEDWVSMGATATRETWAAAQLATEVLASEILVAAQALELRLRELDDREAAGYVDESPRPNPGRATRAVLEHLRDAGLVPILEDISPRRHVAAVREMIEEGSLAALPAVREALAVE